MGMVQLPRLEWAWYKFLAWLGVNCPPDQARSGGSDVGPVEGEGEQVQLRVHAGLDPLEPLPRLVEPPWVSNGHGVHLDPVVVVEGDGLLGTSSAVSRLHWSA